MTLMRVSGVPVHVHWTLGALLVGWVGVAALSGHQGWMETFALALVFFGSVLAHEVGHMLAARAFAVRTFQILLLPIGGVAQMERRALSPFEDLLISVAGPAVNLVVGGLVFLPALLLADDLLLKVAIINLALGLFNLIPAFPMDGGRVLRAVLTELWGARSALTPTLAVGFAFALVFFVMGSVLPEIGLVILAVLMAAMQWQEYRVQQRLQAMTGA